MGARRHIIQLALVACAAAPAPGRTQAPPRRVSYGVEVAFRSGHADRGFLISDRAVIQPVSWLGWRGTELSLWGSVPLSPNTDGSRPHIAEFELARADTLGTVTIAPALRMYFYHDALSRERDRSLEGWLNLSIDLGAFSVFVTPSLDLLTYQGAYFIDSGLESERHITARLELGGSLRAGWASWRFNDEYAGVPKSTLDRVSAEGWLTAYLTTNLYIAPHVEYNVTVDSDVRAVTGPHYLLLRVGLGGEF